MSGTEELRPGLLAGKTAVITGAGRVIARRFVSEGAKVLVSDFTGEQGRDRQFLAHVLAQLRSADLVRLFVGQGGHQFADKELCREVRGAGNPGECHRARLHAQ